MNLFGDFKTEGKELGQDEKKILLDRCCKTIEYVHKMHSNMRILVATDSTTLLNMASTIPYVYIIPGEIIHTGYQISSDVESAMKTFVDMYMISYAKIVYQVRDPLLYHSGFPLRAARISGTDYQEINMEY